MKTITLIHVGKVVYGPAHRELKRELVKQLTDLKSLVCNKDEVSEEIANAIQIGLNKTFKGRPIGREGHWTVWIEPGTHNVRVVMMNEDQSEQVHTIRIRPVMTLTDKGKVERWIVNLGKIIVIPTHVEERGARDGEIHTGPFSYWEYSGQKIEAHLSHRIYNKLLRWCMRFGQPGQSETWELLALIGTDKIIAKRDGAHKEELRMGSASFCVREGILT